MTDESVAEPRPRSTDRRSVARRVSVIVAAAVPALLYLLYVSHYSINVPTADDWNLVPLASVGINHTVPLKELWGQYGDTRLLLLKVMYAWSGKHDHLDTKHLILFGAGAYIAAFVILLALFRSYLRRALTFFPVLALGVVWFSLADVINSLWAFQTAWFLVVFFFIATTYFLLVPGRFRPLFLALAIVAAVLASFTEVQGFVVWPAGLICLVWTTPWRRRTLYESVIWCSAAVLAVAIYLHNFNFKLATNICQIEGGTKEGCSLTYGLSHPIQFAKFLSILAGNVVPTLPGLHVGAHELLGTLIWIVAGFVVVQSIRERRSRPNPLPVILIAFALQFDLMLSLSRLGQGAVGAGKNWYLMPNIVLLSGIVVYAAAHIRDVRETRTLADRREVLEMIGAVALTAFLIFQVNAATRFGITNGRSQRAHNLLTARVIVNKLKIPDAKRGCYMTAVIAGPPLPVVYEVTEIARQQRFSFFDPGSIEQYVLDEPPSLPQCDQPVPAPK